MRKDHKEQITFKFEIFNSLYIYFNIAILNPLTRVCRPYNEKGIIKHIHVFSNSPSIFKQILTLQWKQSSLAH